MLQQKKVEAQELPTHTFLSEAATVSAEVLLAVYVAREGFPRAGRFLQGATVQQLDLLYSGGFLGPKTS